MPARLPRIGTAVALSSAYQPGTCQPAARATASIRSRASLRLSLLNTAARTAPPGRVTRANSASPDTGSVTWLSTNAPTLSSTEPSASGRTRISATAHGGRAAASQASMPADRSKAMTRARRALSAELAAPVPAPASSTVRPLREWGLIATSSAAIGP